jgi:hypothetical protein
MARIPTSIQAARLAAVLRGRPGASAVEAHAALRAAGYVGSYEDVLWALESSLDRFVKGAGDDALWSLRGAARLRPLASAPDTQEARLNKARERRGEPILDRLELQQVIARLQIAGARRSQSTTCWQCKSPVSDGTNERCRICDWRVCVCGGCRDPRFPDHSGRTGACPGSFAATPRLLLADRDFRGDTPLLAGPIAPEADEIREVVAGKGLRSVFHWSPVRAAESIVRYGLLSRDRLDREHIPSSSTATARRRSPNFCIPMSPCRRFPRAKCLAHGVRHLLYGSWTQAF